jgi:hypothetical protein
MEILDSCQIDKKCKFWDYLKKLSRVSRFVAIAYPTALNNESKKALVSEALHTQNFEQTE